MRNNNSNRPPIKRRNGGGGNGSSQRFTRRRSDDDRHRGSAIGAPREREPDAPSLPIGAPKPRYSIRGREDAPDKVREDAPAIGKAVLRPAPHADRDAQESAPRPWRTDREEQSESIVAVSSTEGAKAISKELDFSNGVFRWHDRVLVVDAYLLDTVDKDLSRLAKNAAFDFVLQSTSYESIEKFTHATQFKCEGLEDALTGEVKSGPFQGLRVAAESGNYKSRERAFALCLLLAAATKRPESVPAARVNKQLEHEHFSTMFLHVSNSPGRLEGVFNAVPPPQAINDSCRAQLRTKEEEELRSELQQERRRSEVAANAGRLHRKQLDEELKKREEELKDALRAIETAEKESQQLLSENLQQATRITELNAEHLANEVFAKKQHEREDDSTKALRARLAKDEDEKKGLRTRLAKEENEKADLQKRLAEAKEEVKKRDKEATQNLSLRRKTDELQKQIDDLHKQVVESNNKMKKEEERAAKAEREALQEKGVKVSVREKKIATLETELKTSEGKLCAQRAEMDEARTRLQAEVAESRDHMGKEVRALTSELQQERAKRQTERKEIEGKLCAQRAEMDEARTRLQTEVVESRNHMGEEVRALTSELHQEREKRQTEGKEMEEVSAKAAPADDNEQKISALESELKHQKEINKNQTGYFAKIKKAERDAKKMQDEIKRLNEELQAQAKKDDAEDTEGPSSGDDEIVQAPTVKQICRHELEQEWKNNVCDLCDSRGIETIGTEWSCPAGCEFDICAACYETRCKKAKKSKGKQKVAGVVAKSKEKVAEVVSTPILIEEEESKQENHESQARETQSQPHSMEQAPPWRTLKQQQQRAAESSHATAEKAQTSSASEQKGKDVPAVPPPASSALQALPPRPAPTIAQPPAIPQVVPPPPQPAPTILQHAATAQVVPPPPPPPTISPQQQLLAQQMQQQQQMHQQQKMQQMQQMQQKLAQQQMQQQQAMQEQLRQQQLRQEQAQKLQRQREEVAAKAQQQQQQQQQQQWGADQQQQQQQPQESPPVAAGGFSWLQPEATGGAQTVAPPAQQQWGGPPQQLAPVEQWNAGQQTQFAPAPAAPAEKPWTPSWLVEQPEPAPVQPPVQSWQAPAPEPVPSWLQQTQPAAPVVVTPSWLQPNAGMAVAPAVAPTPWGVQPGMHPVNSGNAWGGAPAWPMQGFGNQGW